MRQLSRLIQGCYRRNLIGGFIGLGEYPYLSVMKILFWSISMLFVTWSFGQQTQFALPLEEMPSTTDLSSKAVSLNTVFSFEKASKVKIISTGTVRGIPTIDHLPSLFCKLEYQLESKSKLAPRFRLGSLQYTNWMEGKGDLYTRYSK